MVYYFTSSVVDPPGNIYVGKDKFESERRSYTWRILALLTAAH